MATEGLVFMKGHLYIDSEGDNIEIGEVQEASFEIRDTTVKARGKGLFPLAVRLADREGTVRCKWLQIMAQGVQKVLGGTVTYADDETTLAVVKTSEPSNFRLDLENPTDGSEIKIVFYSVRPANFSIPLTLKEFSMPNVEFEIEVDDNDKVFDIILPGYQSTQ